MKYLTIPELGCREPTQIKLADVGYIREGRFHLLFSAGLPLGTRKLGIDVPFTFEPLDFGLVVRSQPRPPGYLRTSTVEEIGVDMGASSFVPRYDSHLIQWLFADVRAKFR